MVTSLSLWLLSDREAKSAVSGVQAPPVKTEAPLVPGAKPPAGKTDANAAVKTPADKPAAKTTAPATTTPSSGRPALQPAPKK